MKTQVKAQTSAQRDEQQDEDENEDDDGEGDDHEVPEVHPQNSDIEPDYSIESIDSIESQ